MWISSRWRDDEWRHMWFLPSGRQYPVDATRPTISATMIREIIVTTPIEELYDKIKDMVLNPDKLARMVE